MAQGLTVDQTAIKFAQLVIAVWVVVAGALQAPWLIAFLTAALATSAASPTRSLFRLLYHRVAVPLRLARPRIIPDDPAPHRFAQGVGAAVLAASTLALFVGASTLGWVLAGLVAVLALLNVTAGFCAGCFVYYQLSRRGWLPRRPEGA
ncbi:MAG: DUF4395 domain-containing protein [Armatimonadota bacterium]|nr:DUF4395 domain-containing protein [Armatimonadota bacterium]MDR7518232.1 DUF4395 domain-containing protein [Armatimonadota bacterium]MDR7548656.1 DUF4395 domain-containing protein [Armatimonadota bacterium]